MEGFGDTLKVGIEQIQKTLVYVLSVLSNFIVEPS
jgi:hypothetical protein